MITLRLKELRIALQLNQMEFAQKIGVSKGCVVRWEKGDSAPNIEMLRKICETFHVSANYLLDLESQSFLDVSGLSIQQILHLQWLADDLKK
ncbi:MAG: helix-turn-helix transcriptional regulator [Oscillospiraceae bacterium]